MADEARPERLHALDAVRAFALLIGIAFHASLAYLAGPQIWFVADKAKSVELDVFFFVVHMFRMTIFFLIAGFFARMSFHRRGLAGFLGDRLKRIALPLVVGWPIVFVLIIAVLIWSAVVANGGSVPKNAPPPPAITAATFPLTHLWFLYVLLMFYAAALLLRGVFVLADWKGGLRAWLDGPVAALVRFPLAAVVFAAPVAVALVLYKPWVMWFGVPTPDTGIVPNTPSLVGFGVAFAFGWLLNRQPDLMNVWRNRWPLNLVLAIGLTVACLAIVGLKPVIVPAAQDETRIYYAALYGSAVWCWVFAIVGFALQFLSGEGRVARYLADSSYWLYIAHLPLVMALQVAVSQFDWPWYAKFAAILAVTYGGLLLSYQLLVRYTFIGAILNGRRRKHATVEE